MFQSRRRASLVAASAFLVMAAPAFAQNHPEDGVARNLLERQQQEHDFHVRLYDNAPPRPMALSPELPLPLETSPKSPLDLGRPLPANPTVNQAVSPQVPDAFQRRQLEVSQQQRLQQLQLQNKDLDEPVRQQQTQIQQLQFERENQAQSLHERILRDSQGSMRQVR